MVTFNNLSVTYLSSTAACLADEMNVPKRQVYIEPKGNHYSNGAATANMASAIKGIGNFLKKSAVPKLTAKPAIQSAYRAVNMILPILRLSMEPAASNRSPAL